MCRPYWLWQHADPQQNVREQFAADESLNCRNRCMRLPTGSWQYRLRWLKGLNQWWYVHETTQTEGAALGQCQGIVMGAAQMLSQGFNNCTNLQDRDSAPAKRHRLPNRLQTSSYGARKVLSTIANRKSLIKIVKQDCVEKRPNRTSSYFVPKFKCASPPKPPTLRLTKGPVRESQLADLHFRLALW